MPPRLNMDAYADFISRNLQTCSRARIDRQKEVEERITARFRLTGNEKPARPS